MDLRGAAERALRAAASEGLTLVRASDNATGFRGVKHGERRSKPFQALVWRNGKMQHLGRYATAEEAAIESLGGFVPLPCAHNVCVSCMDSLISAPATCESQQPHNRGHTIQAEWANRCPECRRDFSRRDIVALLERGVGGRAAADDAPLAQQ